jgi:6-pyruvoyltetrahydropterin/6-carboxytetrahydropterin synthase
MPHTAVHREIGIDCGHRVPDHASKCRSPHGHRYRIIANCVGNVVAEQGNEEHGMVIDFGHIKKIMMDVFDAIFDHAFVVAKHDEVMMNLYFPNADPDVVLANYTTELNNQIEDYCHNLSSGKNAAPIQLPRTLISDQDPDGLKIVPVNYAPTAEKMAEHMYEMMSRIMGSYYRGDQIKLASIRLYETPNGWVDFPAGGDMGFD